ncbi:MAG: nitric oxide reductase activation protein, partial [Blautia coccoides]
MREEFELELENRIRNLMWTVSGDYTLDVKPDLESFRRSRYIALYDGIKQGAFARYFDREELSLYLVKKIYLHASEGELISLAQLCIEWAVCDRIMAEREGVGEIRRKAFEDTLELDFSQLVEYEAGRLKISLFKEALNGEEPATDRLRGFMERVYELKHAADTMEVIRTVDF